MTDPDISPAGDVSRYTLDEAARELAARDCDFHGHDIEILYSAGQPARLICIRGCRHPGWTVTPAPPDRTRTTRDDAVAQGVDAFKKIVDAYAHVEQAARTAMARFQDVLRDAIAASQLADDDEAPPAGPPGRAGASPPPSMPPRASS
jgi:hypothetical protein